MRLCNPALLGVALAVLAGGCSGGARRAAALDAAALSYRAGEPAFVVHALGAVRDGDTGVDVYLGVPRSSLTFRPAGDALQAVARWTVTLERDGATVDAETSADTLREVSADAARQPEPVWRRVRIDAPPGRYRVRVVLEDPTSERTAERGAGVDVVAVGRRPALGEIRLESTGDGGRAVPVDPVTVPAAADSLRAVAQATSVPDRATAVLTVVRLRSDASPASPPTGAPPASGSLARHGVDPSQADTVQVARQPVAAGDVLDVEAPLPALAAGVYAVRLTLEAPAGTPLAAAARVVVVRRPGYPALTHLADLAEPLVYLADRREVERILNAGTPAARRRAFDRFWGERMDDRRLAAATVRVFYERVEEANRLFATYEDGWKTDRGMIYVLFGPPGYVEPRADGERWTYDDGRDTPATVTFERPAGRDGDGGLFSVLTLVRDRGYSEAWERARSQWRSGVVP